MNKGKFTGRIIMLTGGVFVIAAVVLTLYNIHLENTAKKLSSEVLSLMDMEDTSINQNYLPDYRVNPDMDMPVRNINGKDFVGTISIPAIDMNLPVMAECNLDNLKISPCVYEGTAYKKDLIIAGHDYRTHFGPINDLIRGDTVIFKDTDGNVFEYEVMYSEIIDEKDIESMSNGEWDLTLFTCTYSGATRITVRCRLSNNKYE
ncbi:MAG: sortase [Clostridia bacterium]|nr:sortase [Clostridia bacterium]